MNYDSRSTWDSGLDAGSIPARSITKYRFYSDIIPGETVFFLCKVCVDIYPVERRFPAGSSFHC